MRFSPRLLSPLILLLAALPVWGAGSLLPKAYTVHDLGTLGGAESDARALNNRGEIVGAAETGKLDADGKPIKHAFRWHAGHMSDLGTLGGTNSAANAIDDGESVAGESETDAADPSVLHAAWWNSLKKIHDLGGGVDGRHARALGTRFQSVAGESSSYVVGEANSASGIPVATIWRDRQTLYQASDDLGPSVARAIDASLAVGQTFAAEAPIFTYWQVHHVSGSLHVTAHSVGTASTQPDDTHVDGAYAVSPARLVVGGSGGTAFLWTSSKQAVGYPYLTEARAYGIASETFVGSSFQPEDRATGLGRAMRWERFFIHVTDLTALIPRNSGWVLQCATAINNHGHIVGTGLHHGVRRGFLLKPSG